MKIVRERTELPDTDDIYIFGAGQGGRIVRRELAKVPGAKVTGFIDNRARGVLGDRPIIGLDEFLVRRTDRSQIVIASMYAAEIANQLRSHGIESFSDAFPLIAAVLTQRRQRTKAMLAVMVIAIVAILLWG